MATTEALKFRIVHKHDTEENWLKATNFIPKQGEIIIYDIDANYNYERFKIGDGTSNVNALPFANNGSSETTEIYGDAPNLPLLDEQTYDQACIVPLKIRVKNNTINYSGTGNLPYYQYFDRTLEVPAYTMEGTFYSETFTVSNYSGGMEDTTTYTVSITFNRGNWTINNDSNGIITFLMDEELTTVGAGRALRETSDRFSVTTAWDGSNDVPAIKVGNTVLTETKLSQLIAYIDGLASGDPAVVEPIAQNYLDTTVAEEATW